MSESLRNGMLYPHNVLEGYGFGAITDYRVRIALSLLSTSPIYTNAAVQKPEAVARHALELADAVLRIGEEHSMVKSLPDASDTEIDDSLRAQARRTASYQVLQQIEGQKFAQMEQASSIVPAAPGPRRSN